MKKLFSILKDDYPISILTSSITEKLNDSSFYVEKEFSDKLYNYVIFDFNPDIVLSFDIKELENGLLEELAEKNPKILFVFYFVEKLKNSEIVNEKLKKFKHKKLIITAFNDDKKILSNSHFVKMGIDTARYSKKQQDFGIGISIAENPSKDENIKVIIDLMNFFGGINLYCDKYDFMKSCTSDLWNNYPEKVKDKYKSSYKNPIETSKERSDIFSKTMINVVLDEWNLYQVQEIASSSGVAFVRDNKLYKDNFSSGYNIETYKDINELIQKIDFYIKNPSILRGIAYNARICAVNSNSIIDTVQHLKKIISAKIN